MLAIEGDTSLRPRLVLLASQSFAFGLTLSLLIIPASALFISTFGSERLPYTYIVVALLGFVSASTLSALQRRWTLPQLAITNSGLVTAVLVASWLGLTFADARWVSFILLVLFSLQLQIGFVFIGGQAGRLFEVRQIKRLFPRIVSGFAIGFLVGGLLAVPLVNLLGKAENLLLATTASALLLLTFQIITSRRFRAELGQVVSGGSQQPRLPLRKLLFKRFIALILLYQMLSAMASQLLDFMVFDQAARRYSGSETLAQFVGNYTWILNLTDILFLALVAGYLLNRFGLRFGLAANPAGVGLLLIAMLVVGLLLGPASLPFFILVVVARISDIALTDGATRTSLNAAYQALVPAERLAVQTGVEGIGVPLALGLTGAILLLFNAIPGLTTIHLVLLTLLVTVGWLGSGILVYRDYGANLLRILKRRILGEAELTIADGSTLAVVERLIESDQLRDVRLGLDMLADAGHPTLFDHLGALVRQGRPEMQVEALSRIERLRLQAALPDVEEAASAVTETPAAEVAGSALRALAALRAQEAVDLLLPHLDHAEEEVRLGAMVGLLRYGGLEGATVAAPRLRALETAPDPAQRRFLAQVLCEVEPPNAYHALPALLQDEDVTVRQAALLASNPARHPALLPLVAAALEDAATRSAAIAVLIETEADLAPLLDKSLSINDGNKSRWLLHVCRQVKRPAVLPVLKQYITHPDRGIRAQVLATLAAYDYEAADVEKAVIHETIRQEVHYALRRLATLADFGQEDALVALQRALGDELREAFDQLFYYLSFLYDSDGMRRAASRLRQGNPEAQALATEMLDVTLSPEMRRLVLPLVEPTKSVNQRIQALAGQFPVKPANRDARLREILENKDGAWPSVWTRVCACYAAQRLGSVEKCTAEESDPMLLTIERVAILNKLDIFSGTPDYVLATVAQIVEEVEVKPGATFIEEGVEEACMYIVVDGNVRVHHDNHTIIVLGPGNSVGELAVLDPAPRSASVTAMNEALLLRLDKEPFDEALADRPDIAQGVIRALARRLREQAQLAGKSAEDQM